MNARRAASWHATGLVEKAWKRVNPPTRDELARRIGVEGSDLSSRNTSTPEKPRRMTLAYAERIVMAVRQDDPTFSLADLGAPISVIAEEDPTFVGRLGEVETKYEVQRGALEALEDVVAALEERVRRLEGWRRGLGASS